MILPCLLLHQDVIKKGQDEPLEIRAEKVIHEALEGAGPVLWVGERGDRLGFSIFLLKNRPFKTNYP